MTESEGRRFSVPKKFGARQGAAVIIGCLFVFAVMSLSGKKTEHVSAPSIGSVTALVGEADFRLPAALSYAALANGDKILSGEQIVAHEAAQVTLSFSGGASIRLQPGARLVAEKDSSQTRGGVLATLLEGDADVLAAGTGFRLLKDGRDVTSGGHTGETEKLVMPTAPAGRLFTSPTTKITATGEVSNSVVTASTPVEVPAVATAPASGSGDETNGGDSKDSLSNDEIRRAMGGEVGFYRRCYLTYLNRAHIDASKAAAASVTVGFTIANTGKVHDAHVVRSDFNDAVLTSCVLETVGRTPFRAFKANDIPVLEFPIELK